MCLRFPLWYYFFEIVDKRKIIMEQNIDRLAVFDIVLLSIVASSCVIACFIDIWLATMSFVSTVFLFLAFCARYPSSNQNILAQLSPVLAFFIALMTVYILGTVSTVLMCVYAVVCVLVFGLTLYTSRRDTIHNSRVNTVLP